jgi:hypothetical protein
MRHYAATRFAVKQALQQRAVFVANQRSARLAIALKIGLNAVKYLDGHDRGMFADMGLVLVLDFANVGDIGEQFVECISCEGSATASIALFRHPAFRRPATAVIMWVRTTWHFIHIARKLLNGCRHLSFKVVATYLFLH